MGNPGQQFGLVGQREQPITPVLSVPKGQNSNCTPQRNYMLSATCRSMHRPRHGMHFPREIRRTIKLNNALALRPGRRTTSETPWTITEILMITEGSRRPPLVLKRSSRPPMPIRYAAIADELFCKYNLIRSEPNKARKNHRQTSFPLVSHRIAQFSDRPEGSATARAPKNSRSRRAPPPRRLLHGNSSRGSSSCKT